MHDDQQFQEKWWKTEVEEVVRNNVYHSPELSMDEGDDEPRKFKVVDLVWQSSEVRW